MTELSQGYYAKNWGVQTCLYVYFRYHVGQRIRLYGHYRRKYEAVIIN